MVDTLEAMLDLAMEVSATVDLDMEDLEVTEVVTTLERDLLMPTRIVMEATLEVTVVLAMGVLDKELEDTDLCTLARDQLMKTRMNLLPIILKWKK